MHKYNTLINLFLVLLTIGELTKTLTAEATDGHSQEERLFKHDTFSSRKKFVKRSVSSFYPGFGGGGGIGAGNGYYPGSGIGIYPQNPGNGIYNPIPNNINAYCGGYNEVDCSSICYYQGYTFYQCQPNQCYCF